MSPFPNQPPEPIAMRLACTLLLLVATSGVSVAQVSVTGRIEPVAAPPPCAAGATHKLADTNVHLLSTTLDLTAVPPVWQVFSGPDVGAGCPLLDVVSISNPTYNLSVCNVPAIGCTVTLDQCPSPTTGTFFLAASVNPGYLPLGPSAGTILLDPFTTFLVTSGAQTAVCQSSPLSLTGGVAVGASFLIQGLNVSPTGEFLLSNVIPLTVEPPGFCTDFPCY